MLNSVRYILTIAEVERTILYRKAKFWVLAGIGVLLVILFLLITTIVVIVEDEIPGEFLLEGTDAYLALYFFSYIQAILIIFVAGDFRKAEEKARLDQVMLSKPMTTANWVLGKYFGTVSALLYLNFFLLLLASIGRIIKVVFTGTGFNILPFLKYFVIASVPSILFMTALMFFLVSLLRSQALALIASSAYVASIWFYFHHQHSGLFDYGGFFAPLFWSDFIGFGDIQTVLLQRLFFSLLGVSLLAFSILLYPRLRQSLISKRCSQVCAGLFLIAAALLASNLIKTAHATEKTRQQDLAFQKTLVSQPICNVIHYDFNIKFGDEIPLRVSSKLILSNPNKQPLEKLIFALNGQLRVSEVAWRDGTAIPFTHKHQLLLLELASRKIQPNALDTIKVSYAGGIDADAFMLARLPASKGIIKKSNGPWVQGNASAWLSRSFAVLPAQCGWYPTPGVTAGHDFTAPRLKTFATAAVTIEADKELSVITQGEKVSERIQGSNKISQFMVKEPTPGFSINIGTYNRLARQFSQTQIEVYVHPKHLLDYEIFADVADTCYEAVESILDVFEQTTGVPYPYRKLALVEVPLQMQIYTTQHGLDNILLQPGIVMIDEVTIASKRLKKELDKKTERARSRGRDDSPLRIKRDVFVETVLEIFFNDRAWRPDGSFRAPLRNYVNFQLDVKDPILDRALELQFYEASERQLRDLFYPDRWNAALSSYDRMRQNEWGGWITRRRYGIEIDTLMTTLRETPLSEIRPERDGNLFRACVDFKAPPILQMLNQRIGEDNYAKAIRLLVEKFRGRHVNRSDFMESVQSVTEDNVQDFLEQWFTEATFPGYRITQAQAEKYNTGKMNIVYQVTVRVQNGEKGEGFVRLVCETKNDKIRRNLPLTSYEEKEVRFVVNEEPKRVKVIPYFSRNRGTILKEISVSNRIRRGTPTDTVFTVASVTDSMFFVLDDQADGFFTPVSAEAKYLRPPSRGESWRERTHPFAFGEYYFGFRVKRAGSGDYPARWETKVPQDGEYELSFYYRADKSWYGRKASRNFLVNVTSADGTFPIEFQPQATPDGWFPLGRFNFSKEQTAVVELADVGSGYLIADAIRWEFVE